MPKVLVNFIGTRRQDFTVAGKSEAAYYIEIGKPVEMEKDDADDLIKMCPHLWALADEPPQEAMPEAAQPEPSRKPSALHKPSTLDKPQEG